MTTFTELQQINADLTAYRAGWISYDAAHVRDLQRRRHILAEGRNSWNDNPDGCYNCGSTHHHTGDCQEAA